MWPELARLLDAADLRNNAIRVGKLLSGLIASTRRHQIGKATGLILALVIPATYGFSHLLEYHNANHA